MKILMVYLLNFLLHFRNRSEEFAETIFTNKTNKFDYEIFDKFIALPFVCVEVEGLLAKGNYIEDEDEQNHME